MTKIFSAAAAAMILLASSASAATYLCKFSDPRGGGWIPPEVMVEFAADGSTSKVTDAILHHLKSAPMEARFAEDNDKQMRARWRIKGLETGGYKVTVDYSLVYKKKRNKAHLLFSAVGFDNTDSGNGHCTQKK